jgi:hypothetical protein
MVMRCCCKNTCNIITGTVAVDGANLVITPVATQITPENEDRVCLVVTNRVPAAGMTLPVVITIGGANIPVYDKFGNIVYGASLRTNTLIKGYYGVNGSGGTAHIQVVNQPFTCNN